MVTKKQIQEILKTGFSKTILSKMSESQIKKLHEMVNAIGFMGMDKPIGRMMTKGKTETKEVLNVKKGSPEEKDAMAKNLAFNTYETEMKEGKKTNKKKVEKNPWAICTSSLDL